MYAVLTAFITNVCWNNNCFVNYLNCKYFALLNCIINNYYFTRSNVIGCAINCQSDKYAVYKFVLFGK